jgi:XTP/dITP diphosphohydrolase
VQILLATTNKGKIEELRLILGEHGLEVSGLTGAMSTEEIETGSTFEENALLKARHYHSLTGCPVIADDSGLEVDALGGAPGLYSARYAGPGATDSDRIIKLLDEMKNVTAERRTARFVCAAALVWAEGERVFVAEARGLITEAPRGQGGFGYDPVFYYPPLGHTFAELSSEEKSATSHRGLAFHRLAGWLKRSGLLDTTGLSGKINNPTSGTSASS